MVGRGVRDAVLVGIGVSTVLGVLVGVCRSRETTVTTGGTKGAVAPQAGPATAMAIPSPANVREDLDVRNIALHPYKVVTRFTWRLTCLNLLTLLRYCLNAAGYLASEYLCAQSQKKAALCSWPSRLGSMTQRQLRV